VAVTGKTVCDHPEEWRAYSASFDDTMSFCGLCNSYLDLPQKPRPLGACVSDGIAIGEK